MPRYLLLICVALLPVVSAQHAGANNEDLYQKPIRMPDLFGVDDTRNKTTPPKRNVKRLGQPCKNSDECLPGLCCLQRRWRGPRICRPQAGRYRRCSDDQVKGGYYVDHCPCLMGKHTCEKGFCLP